MGMRGFFLGIVAIGISGCSQAPETSDAREPTAALADAPEVAAKDDGLIPARYQGVWDYEGGTCARDSDLRVQIRPESMSFYESIGTVTAVAAEGDDTLVTLAMEGEGEMWTQVTRLALKGEGEALRLHTSDGEKPPVPDEYPSKRCPEEPSE